MPKTVTEEIERNRDTALPETFMTDYAVCLFARDMVHIWKDYNEGVDVSTLAGIDGDGDEFDCSVDDRVDDVLAYAELVHMSDEKSELLRLIVKAMVFGFDPLNFRWKRRFTPDLSDGEDERPRPGFRYEYHGLVREVEFRTPDWPYSFGPEAFAFYADPGNGAEYEMSCLDSIEVHLFLSACESLVSAGVRGKPERVD